MTIVDGEIDMKHVNFDPHPPSNAVGSTNAPVTEVLTAYTPSQDEDYARRSRRFADMLKTSADGCKGVATGWIIEQGEGDRKNAFVSVIGWESKEHHLLFRDSKTFQDSVHLVREGATGLAAHHVSFVEQ